MSSARLKTSVFLLVAALSTTAAPSSTQVFAATSGITPTQCPGDLSPLRSENDHPGPRGARASFRLAHCLEQTGRFAEAQTAFDAAALRYPPLAAHSKYRAAALALRAGAALEAAARAADLLTGGASPPLARRAAILRAEALIRSGSPAEAARALRPILQAASTGDPQIASSGERPDDEIVARAWWLLGTAREALGDRAAAVHANAMAWWAIPQNPYAADAAQRLRRLTGGRLPDPPAEARAQRGIRLQTLGERAAAVGELAAALHGSLPPDLAARAWYALGQARLRTPGAAYAFAQAARFPDGADRARFWLGRALATTGRIGEARAEWARVSREFPASLWAARSLLALAASAEASQTWAAADGMLADLAGRFPDSRQGDDARWRRGWLRYRRGTFAEADVMFTRAAAAFPTSRRTSASLFWAARSRRQMGSSARPLLERLARQYPLTYYGQRARAQLKSPPAPRPPAAAPQTLSPERFHPAAEELAALGFDQEAADEAEALPHSTEDPALLRFVAAHRARAGDIAASVAAAARAIEGPLYGGSAADLEVWMLAYPRAHWEVVRAASAARSVDPYLVLAVIREESRFDPRAASPAGAIGLMQLLPSTAAGLTRGTVTRAELRDPEVSIRTGVAYLSRALHAFGGDRYLALAAYNAGPGAARRLARRRGSDLDLWVETIPISETRGYVQRVLESYGIYRWLYQ